MMQRLIPVLFALILLAGCSDVGPEIQPPKEAELIQPALTYENAYNGPLYDAGFHAAKDADLQLLIADMDRNGVNWAISYFAVQGAQSRTALTTSQGLGRILATVQENPGRVLPFINPGLSPTEATATLDSLLPMMYAEALRSSEEISPGAISGLGEMEQYAWQTGPDDNRVMELYRMAAAANKSVSMRISAGQARAMQQVLETFPETKFIIRMSPEDLRKDRTAIMQLLKKYPNLYYGIGPDQIMTGPETGSPLLPGQESFDDNSDEMLARAVQLYKPLDDGAPEKIVWSTDIRAKDSLEPEAYDKLIEFSRRFIFRMEMEHQDKVAYKNALSAFGKGVTIRQPVVVEDTSSWNKCNDEQKQHCNEQCLPIPKETPESASCQKACTNRIKCL